MHNLWLLGQTQATAVWATCCSAQPTSAEELKNLGCAQALPLGRKQQQGRDAESAQLALHGCQAPRPTSQRPPHHSPASHRTSMGLFPHLGNGVLAPGPHALTCIN